MPLLIRKNKAPLGIYIHVPFCRSKCMYCDFYSLPTKDDKLMENYLSAICAHIKESGALAPNHRVDTIYFGGGTPTFFGAEGMSTILTAVRRSFDVAGDAEITFEANPDSVSEHLLRRLKAEGFNRVSLGVQTDDDELLKKLGRPHDYSQVMSAVKRIRKAGFRNLSLDLMYGLPGQTLPAWKSTLENVLSLNPDHISCYGLKVEEGTPLYKIREHAQLPDDDLQADMYMAATEILRARGFRQYEISNFAKKGRVSKHNIKYWNGEESLGFGPDASSDFAGKRFKIVRSLPEYISGIKKGGKVIEDVQEVPARERAGEYIMLRLRTVNGISPQEYEKQYLLPFGPLADILEKYKERRYVSISESGRYHLTAEGFLISNTIISDLLLAQENSEPLAKRR